MNSFRARRKKRTNGSFVNYLNSQCRECDKLEARQYRSDNLDACRTRNRQYMRRRNEAMTPAEYENKVLAPSRNRGRRLRTDAPEKLRAAYHKRRAREAVGDGVSAQDIRRAIEGQKNKCWWCNKKLGKSFHVDHRIPLAKGGHHSANNIVIACASCNQKKHARMPWEFAGRLL